MNGRTGDGAVERAIRDAASPCGSACSAQRSPLYNKPVMTAANPWPNDLLKFRMKGQVELMARTRRLEYTAQWPSTYGDRLAWEFRAYSKWPHDWPYSKRSSWWTTSRQQGVHVIDACPMLTDFAWSAKSGPLNVFTWPIKTGQSGFLKRTPRTPTFL